LEKKAVFGFTKKSALGAIFEIKAKKGVVALTTTP
jgi:hypothetical protein